MSGAEAALRAARLGDEVVHGFGLLGMVAGALIGAAVAAAIVAAGVATGGLALVAIIGGCIAGGGLAGGALARGISTAANLPGPTTGVLALAGPTRVTVNSRAALRAGVDFASSCNGLPFNHIYKPGPVLIAQGSRTVTINGMPMARLEMQLECGAKIKTGSENVTVGGPTATVVEINDNEHLVETALQVVGFVALGAAGLGAWAAGALAFGGFAAIAVGSFVGMNALHDWGESLGPGYGDIMVGVAGFALLGLGAKVATKAPADEAATNTFKNQVHDEALSRIGAESSSKRGPVLSGIRDTKTGEVFYGRNFDMTKPSGRANFAEFRENAHPIVKDRIEARELALREGDAIPGVRDGTVGAHSEVVALDNALKARELSTGSPVTIEDLPSFQLHNQSMMNAHPGTPMNRCSNCKVITDGVEVLGHD